MDNKKLKKLLVATLATSSIFSSFSAVAANVDGPYLTTGDAIVSSAAAGGVNNANFRNAAAVVPNGDTLTNVDRILILGGAHNVTLNTINAVNLYGYGGQTLTVNALANFDRITNTIDAAAQAQAKAANGGVNAVNVGAGAGNGADAKVVFKFGDVFIFADDTNAPSTLLISSFDFNSKASTYKINTARAAVTQSFTSSAGANAGTIEVNETEVTFTGAFDATANHQVDALTLNDGKSAIFKTDAVFSGATTLGDGSSLTINSGKNFTTQTLVGAAGGKGTLNLAGGNTVTVSANSANALAAIKFAGAATANSEIVGAGGVRNLGATALEVDGLGTLKLSSVNLTTNATIKKGTLEVSTGATLTGNVDGIAGNSNPGVLLLSGGTAGNNDAGNVINNVGGTNKVAEVKFTAVGNSTIGGTLTTNALNVTGAGKLTVTGKAKVDALNISAGELKIDGAGSTFGAVNFTGATGTTATFTGALTTPTLSLDGAGTLVVTGLVGTDKADVLVAGTVTGNANGGKLQYSAPNTLVDFAAANVAEGADVTQILGVNGAVQAFIAKSDINTKIEFSNNANSNTLTISKGFQAKKAISTTTNNKGIVAYDDVANITANVGNTNFALAEIKLSSIAGTGLENTITSTVFAPINFGTIAGQKLTLGNDTTPGVVTGAIALNAAQANQALILQNGSSVTGAINLGDAATASGHTVTLDGKSNVTGDIVFGKADKQSVSLTGGSKVVGNIGFSADAAATNQKLTLTDSSVTGAITLGAAEKQSVELGGASSAATIRLGTVANQTVTLGDSSSVTSGITFGAAINQTVTLNGAAKVAAVEFNADKQTININGTSAVASINGSANAADVTTVNAAQGSSLGDVGVASARAAAAVSVVNANGAKFVGTTYNATKFNVTGVNEVSNDGKTATFNNLITTGGATIDSSKGSKLIFDGAANTNIGANTKLKLTLQEGSLDINNLTAANFGATNLDVGLSVANSAEYQKTSAEELFATDKKVNLVTHVVDKATADKFTVSNGAILNHAITYDSKGQAIVLSTSVDQAALARVGSAIDKKKPFGKEALELIDYANQTGNLDTARQKAAALETTDVAISTVETVTSNVVGILNAIDNPGSNAALAPSAGEEYNEQGINAFATPFIAKGTTKQNGDVAGSNYNASGVNLGLTAGINEDNTHLGLALTFANSTSKFKDAKDGDKAKGETKSLTIFGDHALDNNIVVQGILTLGVTDFKATQTIINKYDGKYTTKFASLLAKVGYNLNTGGSFKAMPYVGLRYDTYRDSAYDLKADKLANINVSSKTTNKFIASAGAKLTGSTEADGTHFAPFADVAFGYNFGKKSATRSIDIGNFNPNAKYSDSDKTIVNGRFGVEARVEGGLNATLGGGLDLIGSKTTVYHGSLKLGYKF